MTKLDSEASLRCYEEPDFLKKMVNFPFYLAPMVGLSHAGLRMAVRHYLPKSASTLWPTEMLNSRRIPSEDLGCTPQTVKGEGEDLICPQILGNEKRPIEESIKKLSSWGAVAVDINMGCPVKKALKHNYGVALLGDPDYAAEVVRMAVESSELPVSVKLRAGGQGDIDYIVRVVEKIEKEKASWICFHPRTTAEKRRGRARWEQIKILKDSIGLPVIGNGDVQTADDALRMLEETNCDGVMIGRALTAKPWLFWQLGRKLGLEDPVGIVGDPPKNPFEEAREYGRHLKRSLKFYREFFAPSLAKRKFLFLVSTGHWWLNYGHELLRKLQNAANKEDFLSAMEQVLEDFFSSSESHCFSSGLAMSPKTHLRE